MKRLLFIYLLLLMHIPLIAQEENAAEVKHSEGNSYCLNCHGGPTYSFFNEVADAKISKRMNPYFIIDSVLYYDQNHKSFECTDCHSSEYQTFPHSNDLQMEALPSCLDCHEGDDATAQYNFEKINEEFLASKHSAEHSSQFTCYMCHDPHTYKINARNNSNISQTIVYDNNICLSCHADVNKYQLITSNVNPNVIESHDWLPNQISHFAHVRCIECHAHTTNETMVAHQIQGKEKAVKKCVECHSKNSTLMASLYKFQALENRNKYGFFNAETLSETYIIGANRNYYLNLISAVIFGFVILGIVIHAILRMIK